MRTFGSIAPPQESLGPSATRGPGSVRFSDDMSSMPEAEPLLPSSSKARDPEPHQGIIRPQICGLVTTSVFVPWFVFIFTSISFCMCLHHNPKAIMGLAAWCASVLFLIACVSFSSQRLTRGFISLMCVLSIAGGSLTGYVNFYTNMMDSHIYFDSREYTNVSPDESAAAHSDAGAIVFSVGTVIDYARPMSFTFEDTKYCIAPIVAHGDTGLSQVNYFAAGEDCCDGTQGAFTCGDAMDRTARSGIVFHDGSPEWRYLHGSKIEKFMQARNMSMATYGMTASEAPIFLRWTKDLAQARVDMEKDGISFVVKMSFLYLCVCFAFGMVALQAAEKKFGGHMQRLALGLGVTSFRRTER